MPSKKLVEKKYGVESHRLMEKGKAMLVDKADGFDALILVYAVCFNAPDMVYQWLSQPKANNTEKSDGHLCIRRRRYDQQYSLSTSCEKRD